MNWLRTFISIFLFIVAGQLFAQGDSAINLHFSKMPLKQVLKKINQLYLIRFSYSINHLNTNQLITFHSSGMSLESSLKELFKQYNIDYLIVNDQFLLKPSLQNKKAPSEKKLKKIIPTTSTEVTTSYAPISTQTIDALKLEEVGKTSIQNMLKSNYNTQLEQFIDPIGNHKRRPKYRKFELSGTETMQLNFGTKLGTKRLYHIFQLSGRISKNNGLSWAPGIGVGTSIFVYPIFRLNLEAIASHVNENEFITSKLNLLTQLKFTASIPLLFPRGGSFFIGPVLNIMTSQLQNNQQEYGSNIMPYHFFSTTADETNVKMWIGITAGIRF